MGHEHTFQGFVHQNYRGGHKDWLLRLYITPERRTHHIIIGEERTTYWWIFKNECVVAFMMEVAIKDVNISRHLRLKSWKYRHIINLARNVDRLVDICNGRSRKHEKPGLFTHESGLEMQYNILEILEYFSIWNSSLKEKGKSENYFLLNQTWKSI